MRRLVAALGLMMMFLLGGAAMAADTSTENQMPSVTTVPEAARPSASFDAEKATDAYLATIPAEKKARSDAYFEGGYWLILWDALYGIAVALILLATKWSASMRNVAE